SLPVAHVARRADGNEELAVGREADELPAVMHVGRQFVENEFGFRGAGFGVVDAINLPDFRDVERAVAERHAVRHAQAIGDPGYLAAGGDGMHRAARAAADKEGAFGAYGERTRVGNLRVELDLEAGRKLDLLQLDLA